MSKCFIAGCGPSLNRVEAAKIDAPVLAINESFLVLPTGKGLAHVIDDPDALEKLASNLRGQLYTRLVQFSTPGHIQGRTVYPPDEWRSNSALSTALWAALVMGFDEIHLLGIDLMDDGEDTHFYGKRENDPTGDRSVWYDAVLDDLRKIGVDLVKAGIEVFSHCPDSPVNEIFPFVKGVYLETSTSSVGRQD